jgi:hypothetical protein
MHKARLPMLWEAWLGFLRVKFATFSVVTQRSAEWIDDKKKKKDDLKESGRELIEALPQFFFYSKR